MARRVDEAAERLEGAQEGVLLGLRQLAETQRAHLLQLVLRKGRRPQHLDQQAQTSSRCRDRQRPETNTSNGLKLSPEMSSSIPRSSTVRARSMRSCATVPRSSISGNSDAAVQRSGPTMPWPGQQRALQVDGRIDVPRQQQQPGAAREWSLDDLRCQRRPQRARPGAEQ